MPNDVANRDLSERELQEMRQQVIDWIAREEAMAAERKQLAAAAKTGGRPAKRVTPKRKPKPSPKPATVVEPAALLPQALPAPVAVPKGQFLRRLPEVRGPIGTPPVKPPMTPPLAGPSWPKSAAAGKSPKAKRTAPSLRWVISRVSLTLLVTFGLGVVVGPAIAIYGLGATGPWVHVASRVVPFPAAYVNAQLVRYSDYLDNLVALRHYQEAASLVTTAAANREQVMRKLIADAMVEQLARGQGIRVTPAHVQQYLDGLSQEVGGAEVLAQRLAADYGMDSQQFARRVVAPHLLREQLVTLTSARPEVEAAALDGAHRLREQIAASQLSFAEAARRYSQDVVARVGGDLGYVSADELDAVLGPEAASVVRELTPNTVSDVLQTPDGFSLYVVTQRLTDDSDSGRRLRVSRILLKPQVSIDALVHDALTKARVVRFVH